MATKQAVSKHAAARNAELFKALAHPLKSRILVLLTETQASPAQIAGRLDEDLRTVARHVRELAKTSPPLIEKVSETVARGSKAQVYKMVGRPVLELGPWEQMPQLYREVHSTEAGRILLIDLAEAIEAGTLDQNAERTFQRIPGTVDKKGLGEIETEMVAVREKVLEIMAISAGRMVEERTEGFKVSVSTLAFEVP
jgi:DNA-binding transcriptional ArsR family regulator